MILGWLRRRVAADLQARLGADRILAMDDRANCFGIESAGATQIRGNGCLAATSDEVVFVMWIPRREIRIGRDAVTAVERTGSHLGKTIGRPLLRVRYTDPTGRPDSVAWFVRDLPSWEAALAA